VRITLQDVNAAQNMAQITNEATPIPANMPPTQSTQTAPVQTPTTVIRPPITIAEMANISNCAHPKLAEEELELLELDELELPEVLGQVMGLVQTPGLHCPLGLEQVATIRAPSPHLRPGPGTF
jgi:hypothetical protein